MALISVCFAVYQNEGALTILYNRIVKALEENFPHHDFELLFVNDGSYDNSLNELIELKQSRNDNRVRIITFSRNFGQGPAILAGWKLAKGDAVINMAADLQDPPEQCVEMIQEWEKGNEIVISYRQSHGTSFLNQLTSRWFFKLILPQAPEGGFDFTLLGRKSMDAINSIKERNRFYHYDILWAGFTVKFIPYDKLERSIGKSQYNFLKRFRMSMKAFINVSYLPLRIMTFLGAFLHFWVFFMHQPLFMHIFSLVLHSVAGLRL